MAKPELYEVVKVFKNNKKEKIIAKGITLEQAKRKVTLYKDSKTSMVIFRKWVR